MPKITLVDNELALIIYKSLKKAGVDLNSAHLNIIDLAISEAAQHSVQPTLLESPRPEVESTLPQSG